MNTVKPLAQLSEDAPALFHSSPIINMSTFGNYIFTDLQSLVLFGCFCTKLDLDLGMRPQADVKITSWCSATTTSGKVNCDLIPRVQSGLNGEAAM